MVLRIEPMILSVAFLIYTIGISGRDINIWFNPGLKNPYLIKN